MQSTHGKPSASGMAAIDWLFVMVGTVFFGSLLVYVWDSPPLPHWDGQPISLMEAKDLWLARAVYVFIALFAFYKTAAEREWISGLTDNPVVLVPVLFGGLGILYFLIVLT